MSHQRLDSCDVTQAASPQPDTRRGARLHDDQKIRFSQDEDEAAEAAAAVFTSSGLTLPRLTLARQYNAGK